MIKDRDALEAWMRLRAIKAHKAEMDRRWAKRAAQMAPEANRDWIAGHRPMRDSGQSWGDSSKPYGPRPSARIIKAER